jgi:ATP-dependent Zn protease
LVKAHQVNATHKVVNKWSRKARDIINKNHDHWQRALKNPDKTLHTLVKILLERDR